MKAKVASHGKPKAAGAKTVGGKMARKQPTMNKPSKLIVAGKAHSKKKSMY